MINRILTVMNQLKIIYRDWESDKGLEEMQAKIYNESNPAYKPITAESIINRNSLEKPVFCRYALTENGDPLAYVQARNYPQFEETQIGYPWVLKDCPNEVQDELFNAMVEYVKNREESMTIVATVGANREEVLEFFRKKGLIQKSRSYRYDINLNLLSQNKYSDSEFNSRVASIEDITELVKLLKDDGRYNASFSSDEEYVNYFKNHVLKNPGHCVMVFKKDKLVMASAPLIYDIPYDQKRLILSFLSYTKGNESAYEVLLSEIANECVKANYGTDKPLSVFIGTNETIFTKIVDTFNPYKEIGIYSFSLQE